jgi:hypothetical protein
MDSGEVWTGLGAPGMTGDDRDRLVARPPRSITVKNSPDQSNV